MPTSPYSASFGRLQALSLNFLSKDYMQNLLRARDVSEIVKQLASTWYGPEIEKAASLYKPPELVEVALNRHLVGVNRIAMEASPFSGKSAIRAYLAKWDIQNIELVLSSKSLGKTITETEHFLVSNRNLPAGVSGGNIPHDEIKILLSQPSVEAVVNQLVRYGYGTVLMQYLGQYQKTADLGPMMAALQGYYYSTLLEALKFFQGDEAVIRELIRAEIDKKNILSLLKAKETNLEKEVVIQHLIEGGNIPTGQLGEMYMAKNVEELARNIDTFYKLGEGFEQYKKTRRLTDFEAAVDKVISEMYFKRLKTLPLSIGTIFYFVMLAELERENIRKIVYGKHYNLPVERISSILVFG
ncbi:MAG: V-type ATPase subunit [Nitrososphaerales archaeon]